MAGLGRTHLVLREEDVVKLVCEFLENRAMTISQVSLERESGVINGDLSDDLIFLRQLILDGQWEDCLEFIQPLASLQTFDYNLFNFLILKHKFVELLCIKNEIPLGNTDSAVEEVVKVLKEIEVIKWILYSISMHFKINRHSYHDINIHTLKVDILTLYQTVTGFYGFVADDFRNNCGKKEKLLKLSNFSFYHYDFFPSNGTSLEFV